MLAVAAVDSRWLLCMWWRRGRSVLRGRVAGPVELEPPDFRYLREAADALERFLERAHEVRSNGHRKFGGNAEMRHACGSYVLAQEYGARTTRTLGILNEVQGFLWWDVTQLRSRLRGESPWSFQLVDIKHNEGGIFAAERNLPFPACDAVR